MKEQELQTYEPFWNHWQVSKDGLLGEGSFGAVFRIQREEFASIQYAALKVISIPKSQGETKQYVDMGMTRQEIQEYYYGIVQEIYREIELMAMLKGKSNIISYEDYEIREREDAYGYHIFIRMELATALTEYMKDRTMQTKEILHMGKDLCRALMECQKHNILHRDIKPANIFVSKDGDFKLGDFGVAKIAKEHQLGVSVTGSYSYMAPEIYFGKSGDFRADLYSFALVLYNMSNHRLPFYQNKEKAITYGEQQEALQRRLAGEKIPLPEHVPESFGRVIVKALAFEPEQRYTDATKMYQALCQAESQIQQQKEMEVTEKLMFEETVALHIPIPRETTGWNENTVARKGIRNRQEIGQVQVPKQLEEEQSAICTRQKEKQKKAYLMSAILGAACIGILGVLWKTPKVDGYSTRQENYSLQNVSSGNSVFSCIIEKGQSTGAAIKTENKEKAVCLTETELPDKRETVQETEIPKIRVRVKDSKTSKERSKTESKITSKTESKTKSEINSKTETVEITEQPLVTTTMPKATLVPTKEPVIYAKRITIPGNLQLVRGNSVTLPLEISPSNAVYSIYSSNGSVASVSGRMIQGNMAGSCKITVKSGNKTCSCTVTVSEQ